MNCIFKWTYQRLCLAFIVSAHFPKQGACDTKDPSSIQISQLFLLLIANHIHLHFTSVTTPQPHPRPCYLLELPNSWNITFSKSTVSYSANWFNHVPLLFFRHTDTASYFLSYPASIPWAITLSSLSPTSQYSIYNSSNMSTNWQHIKHGSIYISRAIPGCWRKTSNCANHWHYKCVVSKFEWSHWCLIIFHYFSRYTSLLVSTVAISNLHFSQISHVTISSLIFADLTSCFPVEVRSYQTVESRRKAECLFKSIVMMHQPMLCPNPLRNTMCTYMVLLALCQGQDCTI